MITSCEIVRDLLPLYGDKTISEDGRLMVREHLSDCAECSAYLKMMREPQSKPKPYILSDNLHYKAIATRYRKKKAVLKAVVISAGVVCIGAVTYSFARIIPEN